MIVKTGFGYYISKDGRKVSKYELPIGYHPDPIGFTVVEVDNREELGKIILDKSDQQIAYQKKQELRISIKNKLGLTDEELASLIG